MAYSSTGNPPKRVDSGVLSMRSIRESTSVAEGGGLWNYNSSHKTTDLVSSSFFSNAGDLGMRNGDIMLCSWYTTEASTGHGITIGVVRFTSTSAAALSTAGMITSTFS